MSVLRKIPQDGTYDQLGPIRALSRFRPKDLYPFDLKSATDRWPLAIIYTLFEVLFGPSFASVVVNSSLGLNSFMVWKPLVRRPSIVSFVAGQPLGYYSSWAALSHHYVVWLAAELSGIKGCFREYAVLGDDVVIAHLRVAQSYEKLLGMRARAALMRAQGRRWLRLVHKTRGKNLRMSFLSRCFRFTSVVRKPSVLALPLVTSL